MAYIFLILVTPLLWWILRSILQNSSKKNKHLPPEAGRTWPIIGHLPLLAGSNPPHIVLGEMADKYGPIFTINLGVQSTLVVSNWETAKECFTTNDKALAGRPKGLAAEIMGYDGSMFGLSPYGPYWRQLRKITTIELLSTQKLDTFKDVREYEVTTCMKELYKLWENNKNGSDKVLVEMKRWFGDISLNVILRIVVGKSVGYMTSKGEGSDESKELKLGLRRFFELMGTFVASDAVPFLKWLDIGGYEKSMKSTAKELDGFLGGWLDEHKEKRDSGKGDKGSEDFMDVLLHLLDGSQVVDQGGRDSDTIIKATCLSLILAGADSTTVSMIWALALLLNNHDCLKQAQLELDTLVGKERRVHESDIKNLIHLNAIVKETLRLYPAGPLSVPHETMEDCTINGYHIPSGTKLLTNLWKMHRDPLVWSDPYEFKPMRFLTNHKDFDVKGQNFEYMPFGSGRRICPGQSFAFQVMQLALANLLHGFDFETRGGEPVDMRESIGLSNIKATPLEVLLKPRLPSHLYG